MSSENVCDDWESTDVDGGGGTTIMSEQMRRVLKERERVKKVEEKISSLKIASATAPPPTTDDSDVSSSDSEDDGHGKFKVMQRATKTDVKPAKKQISMTEEQRRAAREQSYAQARDRIFGAAAAAESAKSSKSNSDAVDQSTASGDQAKKTKSTDDPPAKSKSPKKKNNNKAQSNANVEKVEAKTTEPEPTPSPIPLADPNSINTIVYTADNQPVVVRAPPAGVRQPVPTMPGAIRQRQPRGGPTMGYRNANVYRRPTAPVHFNNPVPMPPQQPSHMFMPPQQQQPPRAFYGGPQQQRPPYGMSPASMSTGGYGCPPPYMHHTASAPQLQERPPYYSQWDK